jgi:hypothetical protein
MKVRSYFGQPVAPCLSFEGPEDLEKWLRDREKLKMVNIPSFMHKHCLSAQKGLNGSSKCTPGKALHLITLENSKSNFGRTGSLVACDNHIQGYLAIGWKHVGKLCSNCRVSVATHEDTCESCLDILTTPVQTAQRPLGSAPVKPTPTSKAISHTPACDPISGVSFCLNRDLIPGCLAYAEEESLYCAFCRRQGWDTEEQEIRSMGKRKIPIQTKPSTANTPRVSTRLITSSTRPCNLTPNCAGNMTASVRLIESGDNKPELWWYCEVCNVSQRAFHTTAVMASSPTISSPSGSARLSAEVFMAAEGPKEPTGPEEIPEPLNAEMAEMEIHIKGVMKELPKD